MIYSGWPSKVKRIRFQLRPSFLLRVTHAIRTHDQSSFRAFPSVCTLLSLPLDMSNYNYPRAWTCIRSEPRVCARRVSGGTPTRRRGKRSECRRNRASFRLVENRSTFYVPTYGRKKELARAFLPGYLSRRNRLDRDKGGASPQWIIDLISNG